MKPMKHINHLETVKKNLKAQIEIITYVPIWNEIKTLMSDKNIILIQFS